MSTQLQRILELKKLQEKRDREKNEKLINSDNENSNVITDTVSHSEDSQLVDTVDHSIVDLYTNDIENIEETRDEEKVEVEILTEEKEYEVSQDKITYANHYNLGNVDDVKIGYKCSDELLNKFIQNEISEISKEEVKIKTKVKQERTKPFGRPRKPGNLFYRLGFEKDGKEEISKSLNVRIGAYGLKKSLETIKALNEEFGTSDYLVVVDDAVGYVSLKDVLKFPVPVRGNKGIPDSLESWLEYSKRFNEDNIIKSFK